MTLAVSNNTKTQLLFKVDKVYIRDNDGNEYRGQIERMLEGDTAAPIFRTQALEKSWIVVKVAELTLKEKPERKNFYMGVKLCLYTPSTNSVCSYVRKP